MNDSENNKISKYTLESILLYQYKIIRGLIIALIIVVCMMFGVIGLCFWYVSLPVEETTSTVTQDLDNGDNNTMIGIGDNNVQTDSNSKP